MNIKITFLCAAIVAATSGCAGRFTGGGQVVAPDGELNGSFNLHNVSAADCWNDENDFETLTTRVPGQDGWADTFRGSFSWRGADGKSFTCKITESDGGGSILGVGIFRGTITKSSFVAVTGLDWNCEVIVSPALGSWGVSVEGQGGDGNVRGTGLLDGGNVMYHRVNTKGVCTAAK